MKLGSKSEDILSSSNRDSSTQLGSINVSGKDGKSAYQIWLDLGNTGTESDYQDWIRSGSLNKEDAGVAAQLISDLKSGVSSSGDTLLKLYNLLVSSYSEQTVSNITERDSYNIDHLPFSLFVLDDGDGSWALYKATTTGAGANFVKLSDAGLLNAVMSATQIQSSYESNADTNRYTDSEKLKLASITGTNTGDQDLSGLAVMSSLVSLFDGKVDKITGKGLSTNDFTTIEKDKLLAITGTNTGDQDISYMTHANRVALDSVSGINTGDQDLSLLSTTTFVTNSLSTKVDKITGKGLSTEDYTTVEKSKLSGISANAQKNSDITKTEIETKLTGSLSSHSHALPLFSSATSGYIPSDADLIWIERAGSKYQWTWLGLKQSMKAYIDAYPIDTSAIYVSTAGSDSNSGTQGSPYLTLAKAVSVVSAGNTIIFEDGIYYPATNSTYQAILNTSGTASSHIIVRARNKGGAIFDGNNNYGKGLLYVSGSYVDIQGFEIRGYSASSIDLYSPSNHIEFSDMHVHHIGRYGIPDYDDNGRDAFYLSGAQNVVIERCLIHDIGRFSPAEGQPTSNVNYQVLDHGVYVNGCTGVTIRNSIFYNMQRGSSTQIYSGENIPTIGFNFINNTCENGNPYQQWGHVVLWGSASNVVIANNIFKDHLAYAIRIWQGTYTYSNILLTKNIISGGNGSLLLTDVAGITNTNNYNSTNPLFVDETNHNYKLQAGSPAIAVGYSAGVTTDFDNNARINNDIGAYKY